MRPVTLIVDGDPVPQPCPRVSTPGGYGRAYVPAKHSMHAFRGRVAHAAQAACCSIGSPAAVTIEARFGRPRSHYRKAGVGDWAESERIGYGGVIAGAAAKESIK
jgi:hypothetical protein